MNKRYLLPLSANSQSALEARTARLQTYLQRNNADMARVAYTLSAAYAAGPWRRFLVCQNGAEADVMLTQNDPAVVLTRQANQVPPPIVFMFPGVGEQYLHMAKTLYRMHSVFREAFDQCSDCFRPFLGRSLPDLLYPAHLDPPSAEQGLNLRQLFKRTTPHESQPEAEKLQQTDVAQPIMFALEYALSKLLIAYGIRPTAMIGYSLGEYTAASLAGLFSLRDAAAFVARRAQLIHKLPPGQMLTVALSPQDVQQYLSPDLSIAAHLAENTVVLAGEPSAIEAVAQQLSKQKVASRPLSTSHAFHSHMMAGIVPKLDDWAASFQLGSVQTPFISNVTGRWVTMDDVASASYWGRHVSQPVRLYEMLDVLLKQPRTLLEVGPGSSLGSYARQHPRCSRQQAGLILRTLPGRFDAPKQSDDFLYTLGKLWLLGHPINWGMLYQNSTIDDRLSHCLTPIATNSTNVTINQGGSIARGKRRRKRANNPRR